MKKAKDESGIDAFWKVEFEDIDFLQEMGKGAYGTSLPECGDVRDG